VKCFSGELVKGTATIPETRNILTGGKEVSETAVFSIGTIFLSINDGCRTSSRTKTTNEKRREILK